MNILITGATGFIGSSIKEKFAGEHSIKTIRIDSRTDLTELNNLIDNATHIFHCSSVTRSDAEDDYFEVNFEINTRLYLLLQSKVNKTIFVFSSIHYFSDSIYGIGKRYTEFLYSKLSEHNKVFINRLPGIFGETAKVNYVSVVSTFTYGIKYGVDVSIINPEKRLTLLSVNDLLRSLSEQINQYVSVRNGVFVKDGYDDSFDISVGELHSLILNFRNDKNMSLNESQKKLFSVYNKI